MHNCCLTPITVDEGIQHKSLAIRTRIYGDSHPDVAKSRNGIGNVLRVMGKHEEALVQLQKGLEVFIAVGHEHPGELRLRRACRAAAAALLSCPASAGVRAFRGG